MIAEVCYADGVYAKSQKWNIVFAKCFGGCKEVYVYNRENLPEDFMKKNERILAFKRGGGYWIWKSFIIQESLKKLEFGDYLLYCDSGALLKRNLKKLIKVMERDNQDLMTFEVCDRTEGEWTKRDVFLALDFDNEECVKSPQRMGTFIFMKKTENTVKFIDEYVKYSQTGTIITDEDNSYGLPNYPEFNENRHDQSIFSVLSKKWGYKAYRDPSQWGNYQKLLYKEKRFKYDSEYETYERSTYPTMFIHHRYKVINLHNILAYYYHYLKNWKFYKK